MDPGRKKWLYYKVEELINAGLERIQRFEAVVENLGLNCQASDSCTRGLDELIRLLSSPNFHLLGLEEVQAIADYQAIQLEGEIFFDGLWGVGKPTAAILSHSLKYGKEEVLQELLNLKQNLR